MKLTFTERALEKLKKEQHSENESLLLHYDIEGCGCGVSGIPTLRFVNGRDSAYTEVESANMSVWIDRQQTAFFEEDMKLDLVNGAFRLSSPQGILNPIIVPGELRRSDIA